MGQHGGWKDAVHILQVHILVWKDNWSDVNSLPTLYKITQPPPGRLQRSFFDCVTYEDNEFQSNAPYLPTSGTGLINQIVFSISLFGETLVSTHLLKCQKHPIWIKCYSNNCHLLILNSVYYWNILTIFLTKNLHSENHPIHKRTTWQLFKK